MKWKIKIVMPILYRLILYHLLYHRIIFRYSEAARGQYYEQAISFVGIKNIRDRVCQFGF